MIRVPRLRRLVAAAAIPAVVFGVLTATPALAVTPVPAVTTAPAATAPAVPSSTDAGAPHPHSAPGTSSGRYVPAGCNSLTSAQAASAVPYARCFALGWANATGALMVQADAPPSTAMGPADIQDAYNLPDSGEGRTVAIVDAGGYAKAESDLAVFRDYYGLPACTTANGCFIKVDQRGNTDYPAEDKSWSIETALDLDAVSAACPKCSLLLVEGDTAGMGDLGQATQTAADLGAVAISNSYGIPGEHPQAPDYDHYYDHPGIAVTASTGDTGNVVNWPASSGNVIAVGGTTLRKDSSARGWTETAWDEGGSGCSQYEARPDYQVDVDTHCANKAIADISADADSATGLGIYNTSGLTGWGQYGGTSLSAPLVAAMYALAGTPTPGTYPVTYPYQNLNKATDLNDVTGGINGSCGNVLCQAGTGWDGPTGLGTPNGVGALTQGESGTVAGTVTDSATGAPLAGVAISATDTDGAAYRATSGEDGGYHLAAPAGSYTVTAGKYGYNDTSIDDVTVTANQTTTKDLTLAAQPTTSLTGTVTDGSGHGWPLYAKVTIDGYPNGAVYTDPGTGRYTVDLPAGRTYSLHVTAADMPGYTAQDVDAEVGADGGNQNIALTVDAATCIAPGYAYHYAGTGTDFSGWTGSTPEAGWTIGDQLGDGRLWRFDDPGNRGNLTGGSGNFAIVDSSYYGQNKEQSTSLTSPVMDLTGVSAPELGFDTDYSQAFTEVGDADVSIDGGATWTNVWHHTSQSITGHVELPIDAAAGQSQVQVRFKYHGTSYGYWELDNVFVGNRSCDPTPGGLLQGQVTDANTKLPVNGATVSSDADPTDFGVSTATADDANLADGYYWLFSSHRGATEFTVSSGRYTTTHGSATVTNNVVLQRNWNLNAGHVTVSTSGVEITETLGATKTKNITFTNGGTASAHVRLTEQDAGFTPLDGARRSAAQGPPVTLVKAAVSDRDVTPTAASGPVAQPGPVVNGGPTVKGGPPATRSNTLNGNQIALRDSTPAAGPWTGVTDYLWRVMDDSAAYSDGKVYVVGGTDGFVKYVEATVYDPIGKSWSRLPDLPEGLSGASTAFIGDTLYVVGGWNPQGSASTHTYSYRSGDQGWTQLSDLPGGVAMAGSAVVGGRLYIIGGCTTSNCAPTSQAVYSYEPAGDAWTTAPDYPTPIAFTSCGGVVGQVVCAGGDNADTHTATAETYSYTPGSAGWAKRADLPVDAWGASAATSGGRLQISGGVINRSADVTNQAFEYDPGSDSWAVLPNSNNALYRGAGSCGLYRIGGSTGGFNPVALSEQLPGYDKCSSVTDVPWLGVNNTEFDVAPGTSVTVRVSMDSSVVSQPGGYQAKLAVVTDTPYVADAISATMTVNPPKTWAKITGTVTDDAGRSLPGATVAICTMYSTRTGVCGPVTYTLKTDADGAYQLWLSQGFSPLEVIAALEGYTPQLKVAKLFKGETTAANFALRKF